MSEEQKHGLEITNILDRPSSKIRRKYVHCYENVKKQIVQ